MNLYIDDPLNSTLKYYSAQFRFFLIKGFFLSLLLCVLTACNKPDEDSTGSLKFSFTSHYGSEPFQALQAYSYLGNQSIKFSKFDFYITNIQLISTTGAMDIDQHALIDLTSSGAGDAFIVVNNIKPGEYTGIKLMIGVTPMLNKKLPKDFNSNDVLSSTNHYWDAWNSFIFSKLEGVLDTTGNKNYDLGFAVHTGTDQCLQSLTIPKSFSILENNEMSINLDVDIKAVFTTSGNFFDLARSPLNHNPTNIQILKSFSERLAHSIQLKN